jgi:hypothetical protein
MHMHRASRPDGHWEPKDELKAVGLFAPGFGMVGPDRFISGHQRRPTEQRYRTCTLGDLRHRHCGGPGRDRWWCRGSGCGWGTGADHG